MQEPKLNDWLNDIPSNKINRMFDDTVFNKINKMFISLQDEHVKRNNVYLQLVINNLIQKMKAIDNLFSMTYKKIMFGGSYYKGTKVGMPDEFDLDIVIQFNIKYDLTKFTSSLPGFTKIYIGKDYKFPKLTDKAERTFNKFLDFNMYLTQEKFRCWVESIMSKVINELPREDDKHVLNVNSDKKFYIKVKKSGPAFTLYITVVDKYETDDGEEFETYKPDEVEICVDLVPVLEFTEPLDEQKEKLQSLNKKNWYAVPKPLQDNKNEYDTNLHWRMCFYEQEKAILKQNGKLKSIIRHIKKLRDCENWKSIASYYIETVVLHEIARGDYKKASHTRLLIDMLIKLQKYFKEHCIPFYWDNRLNLLGKVKKDEMKNIQCRLDRIINSIKKNIANDPFIIAKFMLNEEELHDLYKALPSIAGKTTQKIDSLETIHQHQHWRKPIWNTQASLTESEGDYVPNMLRTSKYLNQPQLRQINIDPIPVLTCSCREWQKSKDATGILQPYYRKKLYTENVLSTDKLDGWGEEQNGSTKSICTQTDKELINPELNQNNVNDPRIHEKLDSLEKNVSMMMYMIQTLTTQLNSMKNKLDSIYYSKNEHTSVPSLARCDCHIPLEKPPEPECFMQ